MTAIGFHTTVSVVLLILTASVWMAAGVTHTCPVLLVHNINLHALIWVNALYYLMRVSSKKLNWCRVCMNMNTLKDWNLN